MLERLADITRVLDAAGRDIPATEVRKEWQNFIEIAIEPTGWQALWRVSQATCNALRARYPLEVLGTVDQVDFQELTATFLIEAVQDEDVELPERYEVPLIELWPTVTQENNALNVEMTAEAIDIYRYFYKHIWMPWDETDADETKDWAASHLMSRINFQSELVSKKMHPSLVSYVRHLLNEVRHVADRKDLLESGMTDEELETLLGDEDVNDNRALELMRLNFRLNNIKNELVTLENPILRWYYEKVQMNINSDAGAKALKRVSLGLPDHGDDTAAYNDDIFVIIPRTNVVTLRAGMNALEGVVDSKAKIQACPTLQYLLDTNSHYKKIFLFTGDHYLSFAEYIFGGCNVTALGGAAVLKAKGDQRILLALDGKFVFENIIFDCTNVQTSVYVKLGDVSFKNCTFLGNKSSSTNKAVIAAESAVVSFENCVIENFSTGIYVQRNAVVRVVRSKIIGCGIGIDTNAESLVECSDVAIRGSEYGIFLETYIELESSKSVTVNEDLNKLDSYKELKLEKMSFGDCKKGNVKVISAKKWFPSTATFKKPMDVDEAMC